MRAHLRQIVNTFIHVRQWPSIVFHPNDPVDNETGAFSSAATSKRRKSIVDAGSDETVPKFIFLSKTSIMNRRISYVF